MRRRHRRGNKQKKIIIFSMIGFVCMFSVGYAAFSSEFLISGKGTIIEKEEIASDLLRSKVVTTGDGLYADTYELGRYVYRGGNPENYIWLDINGDDAKTDNEIYRIVAIESDSTIKVVAQNSIGNIPFDPGYATVIDGVTSANSTTGTRYSSNSTDYCGYVTNKAAYYGCNVWGSKTTMLDSSEQNITGMIRLKGDSTIYTLPTTEAYLNTYLNGAFLNGINSKFQSKIATHTYNVGPVSDISGQTLATDILEERTYKWKGKIALINSTDYVKSSINSACKGVYDYSWSPDCYMNSDVHNYLFHTTSEWGLSPYLHPSSSYSAFVWPGFSEEVLVCDFYAQCSYGIYPSFYLKSDIVLSGEGTDSSPYTIVN